MSFKVMKCFLCLVMLVLPIAGYAKTIAGDWQGTLDKSGTPNREILKIFPADQGLEALWFAIDRAPDGVSANSVSVQADQVKITLGSGVYEGKLSNKETLMTGTWTPTQGQPSPLIFRKVTQKESWFPPSKTQFVAVQNNIKLEVIDWGGTGRPLVLLAGLGNTAHVFDQFALKLIGKYHVYGITRRGFGISTRPVPTAENYSSDRLGDDVLAVLEALKIEKPVLAGHSIAGEELSSIGTRHPERVAGLIYLDAGYPYALYDSQEGDMNLDAITVQNSLAQMFAVGPGGDSKRVLHDLSVNISRLEKTLHAQEALLELLPPPNPNQTLPPIAGAAFAVMAGEHIYTSIKVPTLAIFAFPHDNKQLPPMSPEAKAAFIAKQTEMTSAQIRAFETNVSPVHVVRLPNANHYVFNSNEADVLREMDASFQRCLETESVHLNPLRFAERILERGALRRKHLAA